MFLKFNIVCVYISFLVFISFSFSLISLIINNSFSYSGGHLDGSMAFLASCPYIIFICYVYV